MLVAVPPDASSLEAVFTTERPKLRSLGYRLTGSLSEAEDLVQETFVRALERPPNDTTLPWRPWLTRVLVNLGRDRLRQRKRRDYHGPWLPESLELPDDAAETRHGEARYGEMESVTLAFLVALEALSPVQRAVLLLRDVIDHSVAETAEILGRTETYVKVAHHRARERMARYDEARVVPDAAALARTRAALERFMFALLADDVDAMTQLLREDCVAVNDGGREFIAAKKPIHGRKTVITFHRNIMRQGVQSAWRIANVNGLPALLLTFTPTDPRLANRVVFQVECDASGAIRAMRSTLSTDKVSGIEFPALA